MNRKLYTWEVTLVDERSQTKTVQFTSFWSPRWEGIQREVAIAAAAMETVAARGQHKYAGLEAKLVDEQERTVGAPVAGPAAA